MFPKKDTDTLYGFALNSSLTLHLTMSHQHGFQPKGTVLRGFSDFLGIKHQQGLAEGMVNLCLILSITRGNGCLFSLVLQQALNMAPMCYKTNDTQHIRFARVPGKCFDPFITSTHSLDTAHTTTRELGPTSLPSLPSHLPGSGAR